VPLAYLPIARQEPPSALRQLANLGQIPLLGVECDPEGWKSLRPAIISGRAFGKKEVRAECMASNGPLVQLDIIQ
jgi:hypothetical protein